MSERTRTLAWFLLSALLVSWGCIGTQMGLDYGHDAQPAVSALADGDLARALEEPPVMGPASIVIRAPVVAVSDALGGGVLAEYRVGSIACLLIVSLLSAALARRMQSAGQPLYAQAAVVVLVSLSSAILASLKLGHPEEAMLGALSVAAVLAAGSRRVGWAIVLLGLAIATKPTAVLAAAPVFVAFPQEERAAIIKRLLPVAVPVAALVGLAAWSVRSRIAEVLNTRDDVRFGSLWWPLAQKRDVRVFDGVEYRDVELHRMPEWFGRIPHVAIPLLVLPAAALHARFGRQSLSDALALLALLMLLRCLLDPVNIIYYHVPFVLALAAWEALTRRGLPVLTTIAVAGLWYTLESIPDGGSDALDLANALYLVLAGGFTACLSLWMYGPRKARPATS